MRVLGSAVGQTVLYSYLCILLVPGNAAIPSPSIRTTPQRSMSPRIDLPYLDVVFRSLNDTSHFLDTTESATHSSNANQRMIPVPDDPKTCPTNGSKAQTRCWRDLYSGHFPLDYAMLPDFNRWRVRTVIPIHNFKRKNLRYYMSHAVTIHPPPLDVLFPETVLPPGMLPGVKDTIFKEIDSKAAINFKVIYIVSPLVLYGYFNEIAHMSEPVWEYYPNDLRPSNEPKLPYRSDLRRFREAFSLEFGKRSTFNYPALPKAFVDLVNNPRINGDGSKRYFRFSRVLFGELHSLT